MTKGIHPLKDFGQVTPKEALNKDFPVADVMPSGYVPRYPVWPQKLEAARRNVSSLLTD